MTYTQSAVPSGRLDRWFARNALRYARSVADEGWGESSGYYEVSTLYDGRVMSAGDYGVARHLRRKERDREKENGTAHVRKVNPRRNGQKLSTLTAIAVPDHQGSK
jgi:hypothetical protein